MGNLLIKMINGLSRLRGTRCEPEELLLLVPSCQQWSECTRKVTYDIQQCVRCGKCKIKGILDMADRYGIHVAVATGGRLAQQLAEDDQIKAVVAIACSKELNEGMKAIFPKATIGVLNMQPNGPCKDTDVDLEKVEAAIEHFLGEQ
jgi:hypothetical protein